MKRSSVAVTPPRSRERQMGDVDHHRIAGTKRHPPVGAFGKPDELRLALAHSGRTYNDRRHRAVGRLLHCERMVSYRIGMRNALICQKDVAAPGLAVVHHDGRGGGVAHTDLHHRRRTEIGRQLRNGVGSECKFGIAIIGRIKPCGITAVDNALTVAAIHTGRNHNIIVARPWRAVKRHRHARRFHGRDRNECEPVGDAVGHRVGRHAYIPPSRFPCGEGRHKFLTIIGAVKHPYAVASDRLFGQPFGRSTGGHGKRQNDEYWTFHRLVSI